MKKVITDQNVSGIYFKMIQSIEPSTILDFGLFLQRLGAVSRQVKDMGIPEDVELNGIFLEGQQVFPVTTEIYNHIWSLETWMQSWKVENIKYDLICMMELNGENDIYPGNKEKFWNWAKDHCHCILTSESRERLESIPVEKQLVPIRLETAEYQLVVFSRLEESR